jgi:hypothetical protein
VVGESSLFSNLQTLKTNNDDYHTPVGDSETSTRHQEGASRLGGEGGFERCVLSSDR